MRHGQPTEANGAGSAHGRGGAARHRARVRTRPLRCRLARPRVLRRRRSSQPAYLPRARAPRLHLDLLPARTLGHPAADGEQGCRAEAGSAARTAAAGWAVVGEWFWCVGVIVRNAWDGASALGARWYEYVCGARVPSSCTQNIMRLSPQVPLVCVKIKPTLTKKI